MLERVLALTTLLLGAATGANAAVLLSLQGGAPTESGGVFTYVYEARLQAGAQFEPLDFFTLYDFSGLGPVSGSSFVIDPELDMDPSTSFSFGVSSALIGNTPPTTLVQPTDNPNIPNVTVTLLPGSDNIVPTGTNVLLGALTLTTPVGGTGSLQVGSEFRQIGTAGREAANISSTVGPIPEPSTYAFLGIGLLAVGALARRARKRSSQ